MSVESIYKWLNSRKLKWYHSSDISKGVGVCTTSVNKSLGRLVKRGDVCRDYRSHNDIRYKLRREKDENCGN